MKFEGHAAWYWLKAYRPPLKVDSVTECQQHCCLLQDK